MEYSLECHFFADLPSGLTSAGSFKHLGPLLTGDQIEMITKTDPEIVINGVKANAFWAVSANIGRFGSCSFQKPFTAESLKAQTQEWMNADLNCHGRTKGKQ